MKRIYLLSLISIISTSLFAQEYMDTTATYGNTEDVYVNLNTGDKARADRDNWDIAFENLGTTGSVLINGQKGVRLFATPFDIAAWSTFDTTGMASWREDINSSESWSSGAFNQQLAKGNGFDLGWGIYNVQTHIITGDSVFLLQLADQSYKKIYINSLETGTYTFTYADIDGSNEEKKEVGKDDMKGQNFGFYSITNGSVVTREPVTEAWDLVFTEYIIPIPTGPGQFQNYPVTGIKVNKGIEVAQRDGIAVTSDDTTNLTWGTNISEIGSDWKSYNRTSMQYEYAQDRTYFVRLSGGSVWKIFFTAYVGGPVGSFYYTLEKIETGAGINKLEENLIAIYPNPASNQEVNISLKQTIQLKQVTVYNGAMEMIATQNEATINTANYAAGLYFIGIETTQGSTVKKLIIK